MSSRNSIGSSMPSGSAASAGNPYLGDSSERRSQLPPASLHSSGPGMSRRSAVTGSSMAPRSLLPDGSGSSGLRATAAPVSETRSYATTMVAAPQPQSMSGRGARSFGSGAGSSPTMVTPPQSQSIPSLASLQPHIEQQLLRDGDISGTTAASRSEADRRISELQSRQEIRSVDWHETLDKLDDLHSEDKISENTYLQLSDAAMRSLKGSSSAPPAPESPTELRRREAEAWALHMT